MKPHTAQLLRAFYVKQKGDLAKLVQKVSEEDKSVFIPFQAKFETVLASLSATDTDDIDETTVIALTPEVIEPLYGLISRQQDKLTNYETQLASVDTRIKDAITAKVTSGDLVPKDVVEKQVTDAVQTFQVKAKLQSERRNVLTLASIPLPKDEELEGDDTSFAAKKDAATKRIDELKAKGITSQVVLASMAWTSDEDYQSRVALIDEAQKSAKGKQDPITSSTRKTIPAGAEKKVFF